MPDADGWASSMHPDDRDRVARDWRPAVDERIRSEVTAALPAASGPTDYLSPRDHTYRENHVGPLRTAEGEIDAVRAKAESLQLTVADDAQAYLTRSRRLKRIGLFGKVTGTADPDKEHLTALVIGGRDVLVCVSGDKRGTTVMSTRLEDTDLRALADRLSVVGGKLPDDGMSVNGFPVSSEGTTGRGSLWVGLGPPEGDAAHAALEAAIRSAKAA
jgi:hypothetical protein